MGMSSHPDWEWKEVMGSYEPPEGRELPQAHSEAVEYREGMLATDVGRELHGSAEMFGLGLRDEWGRLTGDEPGEEAFARAYAAYILDPEGLRREHPDRYEFIKDHLFYGYEFEPLPQTESRPVMSYLDHDSLSRQIEVTGNGTWLVATGEKIA